MAERIAGVILAGGLATRMGGGDKGLLQLGGSSLLERVIARLEPQVDAMVLNANGDPARFDHTGLPVVADSISDFAGPLAGVLAGLDWAAKNGFEHTVSVAADTPFFPSDLVAKLAQAKAPIAMAQTPGPQRQNRHPTFALWRTDLCEPLRAALLAGQRKVVAVTDPLGCQPVPFDTAPFDPFFNVNTPEDMVAAEAMIRTHGL